MSAVSEHLFIKDDKKSFIKEEQKTVSNPSNMAQIQAKWPKSKHIGPISSKMVKIRSESRYQRPQYRSKGPK